MKELGITLSISSYNDADLLGSCIESILEQKEINFPFEVLVIDNASSDHTCQVFEQYVKAFKGKCWGYNYFYENNRGLNYARNRGVKESQYDYLVLTDADAKFHSHYLKRLYELIKGYSPILATGPYKPWYNTPKPNWFKDEYNQNEYGQNECFLNGFKPPSGINMVFYKPTLKDLNGFNTTIKVEGVSTFAGDETELFKRYYQRFNDDFILYSPDLLVYHYTRPQYMEIYNLIKRTWWRGKGHGKLQPTISLFENYKDILASSKEIILYTAKYFLNPSYRKQFPYFQNFIFEVLLLHIANLSISIHRKSI